ncbi:MAG: GNAT family N-acetyltransferase [Humidesulfovibrio sp.]|nr:GNAT family N-acetyltransferase [Humidesulfovibrio sp.]
MEYDILPAVRADAPAILALQRLAYQSEALLYNDWNLPPLTQPLEALEAEFARLTILKALPRLAPGQAESLPTEELPVPGVLPIVGSVRAGLSHGACQIGRLVVHPEHQRQGLGGALLQAIEAHFPTAERYALFTGARSLGNLRLYERHGYLPVRSLEMTPEMTLVFLEKPGPAKG